MTEGASALRISQGCGTRFAIGTPSFSCTSDAANTAGFAISTMSGVTRLASRSYCRRTKRSPQRAESTAVLNGFQKSGCSNSALFSAIETNGRNPKPCRCASGS